MGKVARREWRWVLAFAAGVMALTTIPYLVAAASQTTEWRFGGFLLAAEDGNSYIAKMNEGAHGAWLFTLPYSSERQTGALIYEFYLLLGKLAGPTHTAQVVAYHASRIVFGIALLAVSYVFLAEFLPRIRQRRTALLLVALGGGFGWLLILLGRGEIWGSLPVDFISPEAFSFLVLYTSPHLALARCLLLLGVLAYLRGRGLLAGLAFLGLGLIQPLYVGVAWILMAVDIGVSFLWQLPHPDTPTRRLRTGSMAVLISSPLPIYTLLLFIADPVFKQWGVQNFLPSPNPLHYLAGYGALLIPAAFGWRTLAHRNSTLARFLAGWSLVVPVLLYFPVGPQRRLVEGFHLPLVILAVWGLTTALRRFRRWMLPAALALSLPTTVLLLVAGISSAQTRAEPVFRPADELAAFAWLNENAAPGQVVLSSYETGNALPAYAPLIAYIGHGPETVFLTEKAPRVAAFYRPATGDSARKQFLSEGRIAYVIWGPHERALGDFDPGTVNYLRRQFVSGEYDVYEVAP